MSHHSSGRSDLHYPFTAPRDKGEWREVAAGVYWLRMVLPFKLDHINLYVLEDAKGWWIVDTGMQAGDTRERWQALFDGPMKGKPVLGVICTHMHPDHVGQAGWLCDFWRVPLWMSFGEYLSARVLAATEAGSLSWTTEAFYLQAGVDARQLAEAGRRFRGFGSIIAPLPESYRRLCEGDELDIGGRRWQVLVGSGHSPEHVCLYCPRDRIVLAGDQIIPRITPNVSVMPSEPEANPLQRWLTSLEKFQQLLAEDTLVLPAHIAPFYGVQARLAHLLSHHQMNLAALEQACREPRTVVSLLPVLFRKKLAASQLGLAIGEAVAHLNFLLGEGCITRQLGDDGLYYYQSRFPDSPRYQQHYSVDDSQADDELMEV